LLAVLACRTDVTLGGEVFVAAVGGIAISEPAVDLAVALSVASAAQGSAAPSDLVVFGELGLAGEVRSVPGADRRLAEAARAGFTRALVPASTPPDAVPSGMDVDRVRTLDEALQILQHAAPQPRVAPPPPPPPPPPDVDRPGAAGTMPSWSTVAASR
jgi:DNA repair protein RadA/Sms